MIEIIKKKVDDWCTSSYKIKEYINDYSEYKDSFFELLHLPAKEKINISFVKEKVALLHKLANEISSKKPDCSAELNKFSGISDVYFCDNGKYDSFRSILKRNYKKIYEEAVSYEERIRKENEESDRKGKEETRRREESQTRQRKNQNHQNDRQREDYRSNQKRESNENRNQKNEGGKVNDKNNKKEILTFVVFALICAIVTLYVMYIRPNNQQYPSYYTVSNLYLRNSPVTSEESKIILIPSGTKLSVYDHTENWAHVVVKIGKKYEGFVAYSFLLDEADFYLLDNVWADKESMEGVPTTKCKLAILNFLKTRNYTTGPNGWQLKAKPVEMKPNTVFYPKLNNGYTKFTSFAFILSNANTSENVLAIYSFQDDETPVFVYSEEVSRPTQIKDITYRSGNKYNVAYTTIGNEAKKNEYGSVVYKSRISINNVIFKNVDFNGNVIGIQGDMFYVEDVKFLSTMLYFNNLSEEKTIMVKIIDPSGTLMRDDKSPNGYTYSVMIQPNFNSDYYDIAGWGSHDGGVYREGIYRFEFWIDNEIMYNANIALQSKKSMIEQVTKIPPITIAKVEFANIDNKGKFINIFGDRLYGDKMRYLSSRIYYNTNKKNNALPLYIKIIRPNGDLISSASSPIGYTMNDTLDAGNETSATMHAMLVSWGNSNSSIYQPGTYTYEIWHDNVRLSHSKVIIN